MGTAGPRGVQKQAPSCQEAFEQEPTELSQHSWQRVARGRTGQELAEPWAPFVSASQQALSTRSEHLLRPVSVLSHRQVTSDEQPDPSASQIQEGRVGSWTRGRALSLSNTGLMQT